jgi:hypothetical protein
VINLQNHTYIYVSGSPIYHFLYRILRWIAAWLPISWKPKPKSGGGIVQVLSVAHLNSFMLISPYPDVRHSNTLRAGLTILPVSLLTVVCIQG